MISIGLLLLVSFLVLWLVYKLDFSYKYVANSLFIPSILTLIVSIGLNVGALNIFNPMRYTIKKFVNPEKTKQEYESYADYCEQKSKENKNYWFLTAATVTLIIASLIFGALSMK